MAEIPRHPEVHGTEPERAEPEAATANWAGYVIGAVIAMAVILVVVLHLTGAIRPPTH